MPSEITIVLHLIGSVQNDKSMFLDKLINEFPFEDPISVGFANVYRCVFKGKNDFIKLIIYDIHGDIDTVNLRQLLRMVSAIILFVDVTNKNSIDFILNQIPFFDQFFTSRRKRPSILVVSNKLDLNSSEKLELEKILVRLQNTFSLKDSVSFFELPGSNVKELILQIVKTIINEQRYISKIEL